MNNREERARTDRAVELRERPTGRSPVGYQSWRDLLFLHWEYPAAVIQATLPPGLQVDTFDGRAFLGLIPFFMRGVRPRGLPSVPGISNFQETNLRTYVVDRFGRPGVWFYSLDANQRLAVLLARTFFALPYFSAEMNSRRDDATGVIDYCTKRRNTGAAGSRFEYRAEQLIGTSEPGTLEFFLIERYLLFAYRERSKQLYSGRVHHAPYLLHSVDVGQSSDELIGLAGFAAPGRAPVHQVTSRGVDVEIFGIEKVS
ncbi:MAG: DUF2071 domain-containing protein [Bdellovibrionota bacterium]